MNKDTPQSKRDAEETAAGGAAEEQDTHAASGPGDATASTAEGGSESRAQTDGAPSGSGEAPPPGEPAPEQDSVAGARAEPDGMGSWLTTGLRPSPSKSIPPQAPDSSAASPETLAPQVIPPEPHESEDLVVIPGLSRSSLGGKLAAMALLTGLLLTVGATWWWQRSEPAAAPEAAAAAEPTQGLMEAPRHAPPASPTEPAGDEGPGKPPSPAAQGWYFAEPRGTTPDEATPYRPFGPSVGRLPDLPAQYWSQEREREMQRKQLAGDAAGDEPSFSE